jgi:hypothetical protein
MCKTTSLLGLASCSCYLASLILKGCKSRELLLAPVTCPLSPGNFRSSQWNCRLTHQNVNAHESWRSRSYIIFTACEDFHVSVNWGRAILLSNIPVIPEVWSKESLSSSRATTTSTPHSRKL